MDTDYNKLDWDTIGKYNRECHPETTLERAQLHIKNENFYQAILDLEFYTKNNPNQSLGFLLLGRCYFQNNDYVSAIKVFSKGVAFATSDVPIEYLHNYATALWENGENKEASEIADEILFLERDNIYGLLIKSQILFSLKEYEKAFYYSTKVLEINNKIWQAWTTRFSIDYCLRDYHRAINDFRKAQSLNNDLPAHEYSTYASSLLYIGQKEEAVKEFERAIALGDVDAKRLLNDLLNQ